jgi:hypothetical protein
MFKIFSELAFILGGSTHLCFKLLIGTKVSLYSELPSADGDEVGVATVLALMQYRLLASRYLPNSLSSCLYCFYCLISQKSIHFLFTLTVKRELCRILIS